MMLEKIFPPLHPDGIKFVVGSAALTLVLTWLTPALFWPAMIVTAWCYYFFRDPVRQVPQLPEAVLSSADGTVCYVGESLPPEDLQLGSDPMLRISVFLSIFDAHVNRIPVNGTVERIAYRNGAFLNASLDKASELNERNGVRIRLADGRAVGVVQIAGLVARRIVCSLNIDQTVRTGERFGLIRFGSRVDVYLPLNVVPLVAVGQNAVAGETILADLRTGIAATSFVTV